MNEQGWIERFEAFARSKPADETYPATDPDKCALAQFGYPDVGRGEVKAGIVPEGAYDAIFGDPRFGALADRLAAIVEPGK